MDTRQIIQQKVMSAFSISMLVAGVGTVIGRFVPDSLYMPLLIAELIMIVAALIFRKKTRIGYLFLYIFTFLTGVTLFPVLEHYTNEMGGTMVVVAVGTTAVIFTAFALYGSRTKRNLSFLGGILFSLLLGLVVLTVVNLFIPFGSALTWFVTLAGIVVFSGYTIYDFNKLKRMDLSEEDVPLMALNIYLDFLNLLLDILRLFGLVSSPKD